MDLPQSLVDLIRAYPLVDGAEETLSDLRLGRWQRWAWRYAARATHSPVWEGYWWQIWLEIHQAVGSTFDQALASLSGQGFCEENLQLAPHFRDYPNLSHYESLYNWLALKGHLSEAYQTRDLIYLSRELRQDDPLAGQIRELWKNLQFAELVSVIDQYDDIEVIDESMDERAIRALLAIGENGRALLRVNEYRDRKHHFPEPWLLSSFVLSQLDLNERAQDHFEEYLKLRHHKRLQYDDEEAWVNDPGLWIRPCEHESPHWFGGSDFHLPDCPLCGCPLFQWFLLDLREIPSLHQKLPNWTVFPVIGCDCLLGFESEIIDFKVDPQLRSVSLLNTTNRVRLNPSQRKVGYPNPLDKQYARLDPLDTWEWLEYVGLELDEDWSDQERHSEIFWSYEPGRMPHAAGYPYWIQHPDNFFCKDCRREMVYVAAIGFTPEFHTDIEVSCDGYQYYFACDQCHIITVFEQST